MKLWKPAVCLLLSGLLLSACAAPAGSASSGAEGNPGGSPEAGPETAPIESGLDLEKLGAKVIIPGHQKPGMPFDESSIRFTRAYLEATPTIRGEFVVR